MAGTTKKKKTKKEKKTQNVSSTPNKTKQIPHKEGTGMTNQLLRFHASLPSEENVLSQFANLKARQGVVKLPYMHCCFEMYFDYVSDASNSKQWIQLWFDPWSLPLFNDRNESGVEHMTIIFDKMHMWAMPGWATGLIPKGDIPNVANSMQYMSLSGVSAATSGVGIKEKADEAIGFFQTQERLITPTVNMSWKHINTIDYMALQRSQQQLQTAVSKVTTEAHAVNLVSICCTNPEDGKPLIPDKLGPSDRPTPGLDVPIKMKMNLSYYVPIYPMGLVFGLVKNSATPCDIPDYSKINLRTMIVYPRVLGLVRM